MAVRPRTNGASRLWSQGDGDVHGALHDPFQFEGLIKCFTVSIGHHSSMFFVRDGEGLLDRLTSGLGFNDDEIPRLHESHRGSMMSGFENALEDIFRDWF